MSAAKHTQDGPATRYTPGPWMVDDEQEDANRLYVRHVDSGRICQCFANCLVTTDAELAANARLIAAAPELLEALQSIEHALRMGFSAATVLDENSPIRDGIRAAIAKAVGDIEANPAKEQQ